MEVEVRVSAERATTALLQHGHRQTNRSSSSICFQLGERKGVEALGMLLRVPAPVVIEENNTGFVLAKSHARHLFSAPPPATAALGSAAAPPVPDLRYLNLANSSTLSARKLCTSFCAASCCLCNPQSANVKSERAMLPAKELACGALRLHAPAAQCAPSAAGAAQTGCQSLRRRW